MLKYKVVGHYLDDVPPPKVLGEYDSLEAAQAAYLKKDWGYYEHVEVIDPYNKSILQDGESLHVPLPTGERVWVSIHDGVLKVTINNSENDKVVLLCRPL